MGNPEQIKATAPSVISAPDAHSNIGHLAKLNAPFRRVRIDQVMKGPWNPKKKNDPQNLSLDQHKIERNALAAFFIEKMWAHISASIQNDPLALFSGKNKDLIMALQSEPPSRPPIQTADFLSESIFRSIVREVEKLCEEWAAEESNPAFKRYENVLSVHSNNGPTTPVKHLLSGVQTARFTLWNLLGVLPETFKAQFNRPINPAEVREIALGMYPLINALSASHVTPFSAWFNEVGVQLDAGLGFYFNSDNFEIIQKGDKLTLAYKPEIYKNVSYELNPKVPKVATGCSALVSKGDHANVVKEFFDWQLEIANEVYFPYVERFNQADKSC